MRSVDVHTALDLPRLADDDRLRAILASALGKVGALPATPHEGPFWDAAFFGLDQVTCFCEADADKQRRIVEAACTATLGEAWFIEKSGLAYTAQMCLLARSTEERQLYSLFAADEASHLALIGAFLPAQRPQPGAFHDLLAEVIETADRPTLILVIQVVLEGWGLVHYRKLAEGTHNTALAAAFERILRDEARHHGSGLLLYDEAAAGADVDRAQHLLGRFVGMVRAGPVMLVGCVEAVLGALSPPARAQLLLELDAEGRVREQLALLRRLMNRPASAPVVAALDARGVFA